MFSFFWAWSLHEGCLSTERGPDHFNDCLNSVNITDVWEGRQGCNRMKPVNCEHITSYLTLFGTEDEDDEFTYCKNVFIYKQKVSWTHSSCGEGSSLTQTASEHQWMQVMMGSESAFSPQTKERSWSTAEFMDKHLNVPPWDKTTVLVLSVTCRYRRKWRRLLLIGIKLHVLVFHPLAAPVL